MEQGNLSIEKRLSRIEELLGVDSLSDVRSIEKTKLKVSGNNGDESHKNVMILEVEGSSDSLEAVKELLTSESISNKTCEITELKFLGRSYTRCL